jgi:hypothetical protein
MPGGLAVSGDCTLVSIHTHDALTARNELSREIVARANTFAAAAALLRVPVIG